MTDLAFLQPWRDVLRPVLHFEDEEELVVGTLHSSLRCLRINLYLLYSQFDRERDANESMVFPKWQREWCMRVQEALELIGLALHYDKHAWLWLQSTERDADDILHDTDDLEPRFELTFHDTLTANLGDIDDLFARGVEILTGVDMANMSGAYHAAKQRLRIMAGDRFDATYRVPVSFVLAPDKYVDHVRAWRESVCAFARAVSDPAYRASSCFAFVGMVLYIWRRRVDHHVERLLKELQRLQIRILHLSLQLNDAQGVSPGIATNIACGIGAFAGLVDEVCLHETKVDPLIRVCTSLMQVKSPQRLAMYDAFGKDPAERANKWRWLGYALSGDHVLPTSIQHLRLEDDSLSVSDMRHFIGDTARSPYAFNPAPPSPRDRSWCVQLVASANVQADDAWRSMERLGLTEDDTRLVVDDDLNGETLSVLVPGFSVCTIRCDSIIDAFELPPSNKTRFEISSLHCGINYCEPEALQLLVQNVGSTLTRLHIQLDVEMVLSRPEADTFINALPVLDYLALNHVSLGSMDVLLTAYENRQCRVSVVSMTNSFVEPESMTRFAMRLQDPAAKVSQFLREFRFMFEDNHRSANGACPQIITSEGAAAFRTVLRVNPSLSFVDIGLVEPVYKKFFTALSAFDKVKTSGLLMRSKLAFVSVLRGPSAEGTSDTKLRRVEGTVHVGVRHRRRVVSLVWGFLHVPVKLRVVSVIRVPRP